MRAIGIVRWKTIDKLGNPIAGVEPFYEIDGDNWRQINAAEEFPSQGKVFWPLAKDAVLQAVVFFRVEENRGHKDHYRVADAHPAVEVIDLHDLGGPGLVRTALALGIRRTEAHEGAALVRCAPNILVGPIKLVRKPNGMLTFETAHPDRIPCFVGRLDGELRTLKDGYIDRTILRRSQGATAVGVPSGYVDWDDDKLIVRRALTAAVNRAKRTGAAPGVTKRMIDDAAEAVTNDGGDAELSLERYRLERARELCSKVAFVSELAVELSEQLSQHPSLTESLNAKRASLKADLEKELRAEVEASLSTARNELAQLKRKVSDARAQASELDTETSKRVSEVMDRPSKLLADVAILRGFLGGARQDEPTRNASPVARQLTWARAASAVSDRVMLQRELFSAFKRIGVTPAQALRLHGAVVARLMPVLSGSGSLNALLAYAQVVCGGRITVVHVAPDVLRPLSLENGEVGAAVTAAQAMPAPSLVVFEGANRSPVEAYLTPFLQVLDALPTSGGPAGITAVGANGGTRPPGLSWASTVVGGAATVPVSRDLWAYAVSLHVESSRRGQVFAQAATEVELSSELMLPGDPPEGIVEEILETWPQASENQVCLRAFSGALARFESSSEKIKVALVECALLPIVACLQDADARADALNRLQSLAGDSSDGEPSLAALEQRLRLRLA